MSRSKKPENFLKVNVAARIDPTLKEQIEELAKAKKWSLSQYIEVALTQHMDALHAAESRPKKKKPT